MKNSKRIECLALGLLVGLAGAAGGQSKTPSGSSAAATAKSARSDSLYSNLERDFVVGRTVYLRSSKTRIGVIRATDPSHTFPPSFPKSPAKAVLIRRTDGPLEWTPVESALRVYVVNKP